MKYEIFFDLKQTSVAKLCTKLDLLYNSEKFISLLNFLVCE